VTEPEVQQQANKGAVLDRLLIDFGPLLIFFLVNWAKGVFVATGAFMLATAGAMLLSRAKTGRVSPMLWLSGILVLVFGGLTIWLRDETFIKLKPTIIYTMFAAILFFGIWNKRPTLKLVLGAAYPGLDEDGWHKLSRNWGWFFVVMAILNEIVWRNVSTSLWISFKLWGVIPLSLIFAMAQTPLLMRHGMGEKAKEPTLPPSG